MKNYFGTLNSADDHLLRDAISANNYEWYVAWCVVVLLDLYMWSKLKTV